MVKKHGQRDISTYGYSSVGAVVEATYPEAQAIYRKKMPQSLFLVPGYGAQGGNGNLTIEKMVRM